MRVVLAGALCVLGTAAFAGSPFSGYEMAALKLLERMTLDEKIGQMIQAEQDKLVDVRDIETYFIGSLLSGGDSDPKTNSFHDWRAMYDSYQAIAQKTRLRIPLLYGVDAVHGHSNVLGAVIFPHNVGLGATRNVKLVEDIGRATALEMRATGVHWTFAPCVAVPRDDRWGRQYEGFAEDPELVAELGAAAVRGLQGAFGDPTRVLACAKHYAGDGGTSWGTGMLDSATKSRYPLDRGDTRVSEEELRRLHLAGYVPAIRDGVGSIMPSYSSWNGEKLSGHKKLLTDILRIELGFEGILISDYDAIDELPGTYREQVKASVLAGMDMFMVPKKYREVFAHLKDLVEKNEVSMERVDDAVRRILRVKLALGLLDPKRSPMADPKLERHFGSAAHRRLARQAVRESLVLLKNKAKVLPVTAAARTIHVSGSRAHDLGSQCGGWTITWQGATGATTKGTTILEAIRGAAPARVRVTYAGDGGTANGADLAIVVVGETPYAEFRGDREDLALSEADRMAVSTAQRAGARVVVVVVSGRPLILGEVLDQADAVVAAWLPGTEAAGVADVLFGAHAPTGKLPYSWPRSMAQIPVNVGDEKYDPLFPYGFGLTYSPEPRASE
jgi:beta-glucosidase